MNRHLIFGLFLCLGPPSGCRTTPDPAAAPAPAPAAYAPVGGDGLEAQFRMGKALLETGNYTGAIRCFAYLRDHAGTNGERDRAVIGLSMALQDSGKNAAALGVLEPLPELPQTALEARKCVLAGELYLHQQNYELAWMWLVRGIEVESNSKQPYRAVALFNLGKALLAEEDLLDAHIAFQSAREIFTFNGDEESSQQCATIVASIDQTLQ